MPQFIFYQFCSQKKDPKETPGGPRTIGDKAQAGTCWAPGAGGFLEASGGAGLVPVHPSSAALLSCQALLEHCLFWTGSAWDWVQLRNRLVPGSDWFQLQNQARSGSERAQRGNWPGSESNWTGATGRSQVNTILCKGWTSRLTFAKITLNYSGHSGELLTILDELINARGALEKKGSRPSTHHKGERKNDFSCFRFLVSRRRSVGTPHSLQSL